MAWTIFASGLGLVMLVAAVLAAVSAAKAVGWLWDYDKFFAAVVAVFFVGLAALIGAIPFLGLSLSGPRHNTGSLDEMFGRAAQKGKAKAAKGISGPSGWGKLLP